MKINGVKTSFLLSLFFFLCLHISKAQEASLNGQVTTTISVLEDKGKTFCAAQLKDSVFHTLNTSTPNFGLTTSAFWFKVNITNHYEDDDLMLKIHNGQITSVAFYPPGNFTTPVLTGDSVVYSKKTLYSQYPTLQIKLPKDSSATILLRAETYNVMDLPISVNREVLTLDSLSKDQLFFGIYFGIIFVMFFYNIFIYFTVKDKNYIYYVFYILAVGLLQACLKGYASKYIWPESIWMAVNMPNIWIALSGLFSIAFVFNFLNAKKYTPIIYKVLWVLNIIYLIGICVSLSGNYITAQKMLQGTAGVVAITIMTAGITIYRKGYRPALFFTISWSFFLTGVIIYILKDAGVLPYNNFTSNAILIGSSLEVALLSFALADKINTYRKEKEDAQLRVVDALKENEKIITEQNVILEKRVEERTHELNLSNLELNKAMTELKDAEAQLVESEKMASLGQLTAGIAHEINNPINFVTSNVKPLNRDVRMLLETVEIFEKLALDGSSNEEKLKQIEEYKSDIDYDYLKIEIDQLLSGIGEGASRTAEIVKGLRIFSRLDEDDIKKADINEGLESTLIIANNLLNNIIKVDKQYGNIPLIECYPGKLNQVFLNMISNAVYAIKKKFEDKEGGVLTIKTSIDETYLSISIADNGIGMSESTKKKMFEPFFTTKDVGEGTGLGLSIAYNTVLKHNGQIIINSELGEGTEFIIKLPLVQM